MPRQENEANLQSNSIRIRGSKNAQSSERNRKRELFPDPNDVAAWFGGGFEIGGSQLLKVSQSKSRDGNLRAKTNPRVILHSTVDPMLETLHEVYDGTRGQRYWSKGGRVAAEIVVATFPYTVARREHSLAMWNWLNAFSSEERKEIARSIQGREWQLAGTAEEYKDLLKNPAFVAGALDSRSYISKLASTLAVKTSSLNVPLLNALQSEFGGKVTVAKPAGTETHNGGNAFITKRNTTIWQITGPKAIKLIEFASPYLQTTLPEGWKDSHYSKKRIQDRQLADRIVEHIRRELALVQVGKIPRISTNESLGKDFIQGRRAIWRALALLTPEEQKIREAIVRKYAKRSIDAVLARRIATSIQEEILAFQSGRISSIRYTGELAEEFEVNADAINKYVTAFIHPELRSAWLHIIRSQSASEKHDKEKNEQKSIDGYNLTEE